MGSDRARVVHDAVNSIGPTSSYSTWTLRARSEGRNEAMTAVVTGCLEKDHELLGLTGVEVPTITWLARNAPSHQYCPGECLPAGNLFLDLPLPPKGLSPRSLLQVPFPGEVPLSSHGSAVR